MKRDQRQELRGKSAQELQDMVKAMREELLKGRIAGAVEGKRMGMRKRKLRNDIARCMTIITETSKQG
jgi:ribosomal protein L29